MKQTKQTFKAGDKVYFPNWSNKIYTLKSHDSTNFPIKIKDDKVVRTLTSQGKEYNSRYCPVIFHATKENCTKLSELYGIQFEKPKSFLDIHLEKGSKVLCLIIKDTKVELPKYIWEIENSKCFIKIITKKLDNDYYTDNVFIARNNIYPIAIDDKGHITYLD